MARILTLSAVCLSLLSGSAGTIELTNMQWSRSKATMEVSVAAAASAKVRTVYLVWDDADRGANFLDWERGEVLGTLVAGETARTFTGDMAYRYANVYRVFTFDADGTGDGYLSHVTTTGSQYIDTGIKPDYRVKVWADYNWTDTTGQQRVFGTTGGDFVLDHYISGNAASGGSLAYGCQDTTGNWKNYGDKVNKDRVAVTVDSYCNDYEGRFRLLRNGIYIRDVTVAESAPKANRTKTSTRNLAVGATIGGSNFSKMNLYRFRLWTAGVEQMDLRPYVKDGVVGCLDAVGGTFFANAQTSAFVAGTFLGQTPLDVSPVLGAPGETAVGVVAGGTCTVTNLPGGPTSDLADTKAIVIRDGTFKYAGKEGEKGYYEGDVSFGAIDTKASTFDITGDLTLSGRVEQRGGYGAFVKTGPGTLRIPGDPSLEYYWNVRGLAEPNALKTYAPKADGTSPAQGYTALTLAEGRLVLGENGGRFRIVRSGGADLQIGRLTVDPTDPQGRQEKDAVLEIAGGTTVITNWVNVGGKNGFVTTCPEKIPESGIRVTGGTLHCMGSFTLGRNKNSAPQQDADGNYIAQRTRPFVEVLGGKLQLWNTNRIGFCDDAGADSRILVDTGTLYVCNSNNASGSGIQLGAAADGVSTASRTCIVTVRNGGTFDCTDYCIAKSRVNVTSLIQVVDGGIYRNNQFRKQNTDASCSQKLLLDGGIADLRYGSNANWVKDDGARIAVGTRGARFRASSTATKDCINYVRAKIEAEDTHPDEEPQGVVVNYAGSDKNAGWVFCQTNEYAGPTVIAKCGRLEFAGAGEFPATSDVTLGQGGRLALTNLAHAVKSFTVGNSLADTTEAQLRLVADRPLTAGAFAAVGATPVKFYLYAAPNVALTAPGAYALVRAPVADLTPLKAVAAQATWANAGEGQYASFYVTTDGAEGVLSVQVADAPLVTNHPAAGGTETVGSFADALDATGIFRLGTGTLAYTGSGETVSGLVNWAGSKGTAILNVANDLTLLDYQTGNGMFFKTGAGELRLMGTGEFVLGDQSLGYDSAHPETCFIDDAGNPPTHGLLGASVADGRLVIGVKDDPANAPHVVAPNSFGTGVRTCTQDSGKMETAGETVLNNGVMDVSCFYVGYYNGYDETTPTAGLFPTFTQNGGVVNATGVHISQDYNGQQATSPRFVLNDGEFNVTADDFSFGHQLATGRVDTVCTFIQNGGVIRCPTFVFGAAAKTSQLKASFNGGDLYLKTMTRKGGDAASTDKGYAEAHFNGTVLHPGYGRSVSTGYEFGSSDANKQLNRAYLGASGLVLDFDAWMSVGRDGACLNLRQPFHHAPDCEGADGGITFRNGGTVIVRSPCNGSTFTGPVTVEAGSFIGIEASLDWFADETRRLVVRPTSGVRLSDQLNVVADLEMGAEEATDPVTIDLCNPSGTTKGLCVTKAVRILSPVTASFHRGGGQCNTLGPWIGTTDLLLYPADQDANVPLGRFVSNPALPGVRMTFAKQDVTGGTYAGCRKITVTTVRVHDVGGTTWTSVSSGGAWGDGANWDGGVPADGTNVVASFNAATGAAVPVTVAATPTAGRIVLRGADGAKGYALAGAPLNLHGLAWNEPPDIVAASGAHTVANDLVTDDTYAHAPETTASGGRSGSIGVAALAGAKLTVTGTIAPVVQRNLCVNPVKSGGGTVVLDATLAGATNVILQSGTTEIADFRRLNGGQVTVGPGTLHYTGPDATTESPLVFASGATNLTAIVRVDNRLTVNAPVTTSGNLGNVMKTGPGELHLNGVGANRLGGVGYNPDWNKIVDWPENGDSRVMSSAAFCLDEGTLSVGREGQTMLFGSGSTDIFIGSQPRGWAYSSDKVTLNVYGGVSRTGYLGIGHGMRRGTDAEMSDLCHVEYNQYGGIVTNTAMYLGYELTKYDSHIRATFNLYGGRFVTTEYARFGQTYNKTGVNVPTATGNIYAGATWEFTRRGTGDTSNKIYMPYAASESDLKLYSKRAPDATLNLEGGTITNCYLVIVGQNGARGEIHLNGGLLNCENIVHYPYSAVKGVANYYRVFNVADGTANVYFNGGTFQPVGAMDMSKDSYRSEEYNATLARFATAEVRAGGAKIDLTALKAARYVIGQTITGSAGDGGLVKTGEKPLALSAPCTYFGETVVGEGMLLVTAAAPEGEILPNSAVRLLPGTTLEFEAGAKARVSKLAVDCAAGEASIVNLRAAKNGVIELQNWSGGALPIRVTGSKSGLSCWTVKSDGVTVDGRCLVIDANGCLAVGLKPGVVIMVR